jgi:ABC-type multidrug transport system fused ATPase/permease subunit
MQDKIDTWVMTSFHLALANRWMSFRMALVAAVFCIVVGAVIVFTPSVDAALAGFTLSFMLNFSESIRWTIRCYGDMELNMNAMERVVEYSNIEPEKGGDKGTEVMRSPPAAWPTSGSVEVENLTASYAADLPPVLKDVSFRVGHNERLGVVGRTGAGKSSLTLALFRFLETRSGSVVIDGLDISKINLYDLRSRLSIIPQVSKHLSLSTSLVCLSYLSNINSRTQCYSLELCAPIWIH